MNNTLNDSEKVAPERRRGGKMGDYPSAKTSTTNGFGNSIEQVNMFMLRYDLTFYAVRDAYNIYRHYMNTGEGLNPYGIRNYSLAIGATFRAMYKRLLGLKRKGLIENIGRGLYIPTEKAIRELSELCEGV